MTLHIITGNEVDPFTLHGSERIRVPITHLGVCAEAGPVLANEFIFGGILDRFPNLKYVLLESGATWLAYWLERIDDRWERERVSVGFNLEPSEYFQRQGWIWFEPEEKLMPNVINAIGSHKFFWATDFPHHDGYPGVVNRVRKLISPLSDNDQRKVLGENGIKVYDLR